MTNVLTSVRFVSLACYCSVKFMSLSYVVPCSLEPLRAGIVCEDVNGKDSECDTLNNCVFLTILSLKMNKTKIESDESAPPRG